MGESKERTGRGGHRPGAGRKPGAGAKVKAAIALKAAHLAATHDDATYAYNLHVAFMRDEHEAPERRLACAVEVMNRQWGKPKQVLQHGGLDGGPIEVHYVDDWRNPASRPRGAEGLFAPAASGPANGTGRG